MAFITRITLLAIILTPLTSSAKQWLDEGSYSRPLIGSLALAYVSGYKAGQGSSLSVVDLQNQVDEIVVNDGYGLHKYSVEVLLKNGTSYEVEFQGINPTEIYEVLATPNQQVNPKNQW